MDFITIVPGFMAFGAWLDLLFHKAERKRVVGQLLKQYTTATNFTDAFYAHINLVNEVFFERYFGMPFLSITYFLRCSIFSSISLTIVVGLQYMHDPSPFMAMNTSPLQMFVLAFCAITNFAIDWLSIGLTQMFVRISSGLKNIYHSIILIFVDLVLTINTFSLVYALPIAALLFLSDILPSRVALKIPEYDFSLSQTKPLTARRLDWSINDATYKGKPDPIAIIFPKANTGDFHFSDLISSGVFPEVEQSDVKIFSIPIDDLLTESMTHAVQMRSYASKRLSSDTLITISQLRVAPSLIHANWSIAYSDAYRFSESAQQSFPDDISLTAMFVKLSDLLTSYAATKGNSVAFEYCRPDSKSSWQLKDTLNSTAQRKYCVQNASVTAHDINGFIAAIRIKSFDMANAYIPINSVFMTSICMTALIYILSLFLIILNVSKSNTILTLSKHQGRIARAPFMSIGFFIGVLATFVYVLI